MSMMESGGRSGARAPEQNVPEQPGAKTPTKSPGLRTILEGVERDLILSALRESHGNKAEAARSLGITERLMGIRVDRLGIDWRGLRRKRGCCEEKTCCRSRRNLG